MANYKVYFLVKNGTPIYIGHSKKLHIRMISHKDKDYDYVRWIDFTLKGTALDYERRWILLFKPACNKNGIKRKGVKAKNLALKGEPSIKHNAKTVNISFAISIEEFEIAKRFAHEQGRTIGNYFSWCIVRGIRNDKFIFDDPLDKATVRMKIAN
jgi:hypothetical protein